MSFTYPTLKVDVYVAPIIPFKNPSPTATPNNSQWSPISCTLISSLNSPHAILIDTPITVPQTHSLIAWLHKTLPPNTDLTHTFTTHAHPDHFLGLGLLAEEFPGLKCLAAAKVVEGIKHAYLPSNFTLWEVLFPDDLLDTRHVIPKALPSSNEFSLVEGGVVMKAYDVPHSDCAASSFLHVPEIGLVVGGDIVYGGCHQMLAECTTAATRKGWLEALDMVAELKPEVVVPGHMKEDEDVWWEKDLVGDTKRYIEIFEKELKGANSLEVLMERMRESFPGRWNEFVLEVSCAGCWAGREM